MLFASLVVRITDNVLETTEKLYPLAALVAATLALPRIRAKEEAEGLARVPPEDTVASDMATTTSAETMDNQVCVEDQQRPDPLSAEEGMSAEISPAAAQRGDSAEALGSRENRSDLLTVARGGSLVFAGNVATRVMNYAYSAVLIWGLGAESFGLFTLALFITTLVGVVANLGLDLGILRYGAIHAHAEGRAGIHRATVAALRVVLPASLVLTLGLWLAAEPIASGIFGKPLLAPLVRALALSIPFMTVQSSLMAATKALKIMRYSVAVSAIQPLAALILAIALMTTGFGLDAVALSLVASWSAGAGLALFFYLRLMPRAVRGGTRYQLREMVKFSLPLSFTKWIEFANERTEIFFLGLLPGAVDIGIYSISWRLAVTETIFRQSLEQIVAPFGSDLSHRRQIKELAALYKTTAKWSLTAALPLFLFFWLFGPTLMGIFDPAYVAASSVLVVLGFAQLVNASTGPCGMLLIMSGRSDLSLVNIVVLFATSIGLDLLLIPRHGLTGAAVAGAVSILLVTFLRVVEVWLTLKIQPFKWSVAKPIAAALVSAALVQGLRRLISVESLGTEAAACLLMLVSYVLIVYLLKLDAEDKLVVGAVKRKFGGLSLRAKRG
jgi:O-antigen/teichoic acid export membrane protein